jgi:hypothetical protein
MSESKTKTVFKSEARPAREIEEQTRERYDWLDIVHAVPPDSYREVSFGYASLTIAIKRLEKQGKIKPNEYYVVTRRGTGRKRRVFLVHRGKKTT